jgi:GDPmannose 4,6-dehydratase
MDTKRMLMRALITGITGQDGSYLAELLLEKGYEVHGLIRRSSQYTHQNIEGIIPHIQLHYGDMSDAMSVFNVIMAVKPDEIYNLAGMSQVRVSFEIPENVFAVNTLGLLNILEAVRAMDLDCKIYQAGSSEMYGKVQTIPQSETTPFHPRSPYGVSKCAAHQLAVNYREAYGMKVYNGILFNHESPRRGEEFLTKKVVKAVAEIIRGNRCKLQLGNLDAKRDWGYAKEYCEWMYIIMQHPTPDDFVIATGETHTVEEFVEEAFKVSGIADWEQHVEYDQSLIRPSEVDILIGDASKSKALLGFEPKVKFKELIKIMTEYEFTRDRN